MYFLHWSSYIIFFVMKLYTWMYCEESETNSSCFFSLDIINGVSANWPDALRQHQQQTSPPCLRSMIFFPVSFLLLLLFVQQRCFSSDCTYTDISHVIHSSLSMVSLDVVLGLPLWILPVKVESFTGRIQCRFSVVYLGM